MRHMISGTALALIAASGVAAQELSYGGLYADYSTWDAPGGGADMSILGAEAGIKVQDFDLWIDAAQVTLSPDGTATNLTGDVTTIGVGYTFNDVYRVDVSSTDLGIGLGGPGINIGLDEIGFAYDNGQFFGRLSYAEVNQPALGIDSITGLHVGYAFNDYANASLSVHDVDEPSNSIDPIFILSGEYDTGKWGVNLEAASTNLGGADLTLVGLGGNYQINDKWGLVGAYTTIDAGGTDIDLYRIGGSYNVNDQFSLFAGYSRADVASTEIDGFNFGMSMDFGTKPASYETTADRLFGIVETAGAFNF